MILLTLTACIILILALTAFFLTRSTKALPKNFTELRMEIMWQWHGLWGLIEDLYLKKCNRVRKCLWFILRLMINLNRIHVFCFISLIRTELDKQPGRVVVITGGNRGIGLKVVEKLLKCDMTIVMGKLFTIPLRMAHNCFFKSYRNRNRTGCLTSSVNDIQKICIKYSINV